MTATTRGSPVGGNDSQGQGQGQAPDAQSQPPLPQNQVRILSLNHCAPILSLFSVVLCDEGTVFLMSFCQCRNGSAVFTDIART